MTKLLHLGCDDDIRPGFDNLDPKIDGWTFESGLSRYADESVDGITISHALMYVLEENWPRVLGEFLRVLAPGGLVRITEDDTQSPGSARYSKMYEGARCATGPIMVRHHLENAGFVVRDCSAVESSFPTNQLLIAHRENAPRYVFYVEGKKPSAAAIRKLNNPAEFIAPNPRYEPLMKRIHQMSDKKSLLDLLDYIGVSFMNDAAFWDAIEPWLRS